jgi:hypothetical protein
VAERCRLEGGLRDSLADAEVAAEEELAEVRAAAREDLAGAHVELDRLREELDRVQAEREALRAELDSRRGDGGRGELGALQLGLGAGAAEALQRADSDDAGAGDDPLRRERDGLRAALDATRGELVAEREHLTSLRADYARLREQLDEVRSYAHAAAGREARGGGGDEARDPATGDDEPTRIAAPLWRMGGDDDPAEARSPEAPSGGDAHDDDDTFETEPIKPRGRPPGAPRGAVGPAPSDEVARWLAVGVLAVALLIVVLVIAGTR